MTDDASSLEWGRGEFEFDLLLCFAIDQVEGGEILQLQMPVSILCEEHFRRLPIELMPTLLEDHMVPTLHRNFHAKVPTLPDDLGLEGAALPEDEVVCLSVGSGDGGMNGHLLADEGKVP